MCNASTMLLARADPLLYGLWHIRVWRPAPTGLTLSVTARFSVSQSGWWSLHDDGGRSCSPLSPQLAGRCRCRPARPCALLSHLSHRSLDCTARSWMQPLWHSLPLRQWRSSTSNHSCHIQGFLLLLRPSLCGSSIPSIASVNRCWLTSRGKTGMARGGGSRVPGRSWCGGGGPTHPGFLYPGLSWRTVRKLTSLPVYSHG